MISNFLLVLFCTALVVTFITDYLYLLIHRAATIFLIPLFLIGAYLRIIPVTLTQSVLGVIVGYGFLWLFKMAYSKLKGIEGIGDGDLELLAMVGSFLGPFGVFYTITFGSILGTFLALLLIASKRADAQTPLPFGSFLVIGCFIYLIFMS